MSEHTITLSPNEQLALQSLLEYLRYDEEKDYESYDSDEDKGGHIYAKILVLDNCLARKEEKVFANTSWCIDDVLQAAEQRNIEITEEKAIELLEEIEEMILDAMVAAGWSVIEENVR